MKIIYVSKLCVNISSNLDIQSNLHLNYVKLGRLPSQYKMNGINIQILFFEFMVRILNYIVLFFYESSFTATVPVPSKEKKETK